jgi:hypothetical protein
MKQNIHLKYVYIQNDLAINNVKESFDSHSHVQLLIHLLIC